MDKFEVLVDTAVLVELLRTVGADLTALGVGE